MHITFEPLSESHFPLLLKWHEIPHVKKWWDQDMVYTLDLVKEKYQSYVQGYKKINGVDKPISGYIIYCDRQPIGYIQSYNAYDFPRSKKLTDLPEKLGALDIFIGEERFLKQNIGAEAIKAFLSLHGAGYTHFFVDPDLKNIAAIKTYEKADFQKYLEQKELEEFWMLWENTEEISKHIEKLELKLLDPQVRHSKEQLDKLIAEAFYEIGASGKIYDKQAILMLLPLETETALYEAFDFKFSSLCFGLMLATYSLKEKNRMTKRTSIWKNIDSQYQMIFHQGTVMNGEK